MIDSNFLNINDKISIPMVEIEFSAMRAEGPGGQHVNKTSSAIHLRFDIMSSSLPLWVKSNLMKMRDHRITRSGEIVIKSQDNRSLLRNREDALERLKELVLKATVIVKKRKPTKPSKSSIKKRLDGKKKRGQLKDSRKKIFGD